MSDNVSARPVALEDRRRFLWRTCLGLGGVSIPNILRLQAGAAVESSRREVSLILLWQDGGPSHFETFDPKPDAPSEYRGELGSIATSLPGVRFCEILPRLAGIAQKFSVVRSLHLPTSGHVSASRTFVTGQPTVLEEGPVKYPDVGAIIHRIRSSETMRLPQYVALRDAYASGLHRGGPAYLGSAAGPFVAMRDERSEYRVENLRLDHAVASNRFGTRMTLRNSLDQLRPEFDTSGQMSAFDQFHQRASDLLSTSEAVRAFDLAREPDHLRDRYGRHTAGQQALLARRLVEAGVSVVAARFSPDGRGDEDRSGAGWDDHAVHGNIFKIMRRRGPQFDQAVSALIEDLEERGLTKRVLVVVAGEFGRTPRINYVDGNPGRDHWGPAGCALVYGGGLRMGQAVGATNSKGEFPIQSPASSQDFLATIYRSLGIDPSREFFDFAGRPIPILPFGRPIPELI